MYYLPLAIGVVFLVTIVSAFSLERIREEMEADLGFRPE